MTSSISGKCRRILNRSWGGSLHFVDDGFQMFEGLLDGQRIHVAAKPLAGFQRRFQIMPGDLDGERIRDRPSSALFILDPSGMRQRDRNGCAADQELNIDCVGVTRRDGNDQRLVNAVNRFPGPAINGSEVSKHGYENYSGGDEAGANG
jgi:hypothetical protein